MLASETLGSHPGYMIDIGRPSFFEEEDFKYWSEFFDYVEESDILIKVNNVYYNMKEMCDKHQKYGGGGFRFYFWFNTKDDRRQFLLDLENKLGWDPYCHYEKVSFYISLDNETCLRLVPELSEIAIEYLKTNNVSFEYIEKEAGGYDVIKVEKSDLIWLYKLNVYLNNELLDMD